MKILREQSSYLPLPPDLLDAYRREDMHLTDHSDAEIESIVTEAEIMSELWTRWRPHPPQKLPRETVGNTLMGVKLFLDRWLVVVYFEGAVYLYDTQPPDILASPSASGYLSDSESRPFRRMPILRGTGFLESGLWITHAVSIDLKGETIFLALSRSAPSVPPTVHVRLPTNIINIAQTSYGANIRNKINVLGRRAQFHCTFISPSKSNTTTAVQGDSIHRSRKETSCLVDIRSCRNSQLG